MSVHAGHPRRGDDDALGEQCAHARRATGFLEHRLGRPEHPAIIDPDRPVTIFGASLDRSRRVVDTPRSLGVGPGDHIAVMLPNHSSLFEVLPGSFESGLIVVPVNPRMAAGEVAHMLTDSDARASSSHTGPWPSYRGRVFGYAIITSFMISSRVSRFW